MCLENSEVHNFYTICEQFTNEIIDYKMLNLITNTTPRSRHLKFQMFPCH